MESASLWAAILLVALYLVYFLLCRKGEKGIRNEARSAALAEAGASWTVICSHDIRLTPKLCCLLPMACVTIVLGKSRNGEPVNEHDSIVKRVDVSVCQCAWRSSHHIVEL